MNPTVRGLIIFFSVLLTVGFWMPLSNSPDFAPGGGTITDTYFGLFHYATVHAFMKEPEFSMKWQLHPGRLALTIVVTLVFWAAVIAVLRRFGRSSGQRLS